MQNPLSNSDRGQSLRRGRRRLVPGLLRRRILDRYSDWNYSWQADIALRYAPVAVALASTGLVNSGASKALTPAALPGPLLDVGCGSKGGVTSYVPVRTVGVDVHFNLRRLRRHPAVTPLIGSGLALPLASRSFDVVLCMDTLEHLAPAERVILVDELFRAVRDDGLVIVGAPCGLEARAAEERINAAYRARAGRDHPWLAEHLVHEPMTPERLRELMTSAASQRFACFELKLAPNTDLALWERLQAQGWLHHLHRLIYQPLWPHLRDRYGRPAAAAYRQICLVTGLPASGSDHLATNSPAA